MALEEDFDAAVRQVAAARAFDVDDGFDHGGFDGEDFGGGADVGFFEYAGGVLSG